MDINIFEKYKHLDEQHQEYWQAEDLMKILGYDSRRSFALVVEKSQAACINSGQDVREHFIQDKKQTVFTSKKSVFFSLRFSRYACYLIVQNAHPHNEIVALAQTYFAMQARKQELLKKKGEDMKRVHLRDEMKEHNKNLAKTARGAGVYDYGAFTDAGYMGLYGDMRNKEIHQYKKLKDNQKMLDHMGSEELAANLFRATQTEAQIKRKHIYGQDKANKTHYIIGKKVRQTIKELGGTMPEKLPVQEHIKESRKRLKEMQKANGLSSSTRIYHFVTPADMIEMDAVIDILHHDIGDIVVFIGSKQYEVSKQGLEKLEKLLQKE